MAEQGIYSPGDPTEVRVPNHLESEAHRMWSMYGHGMTEVVGLGFEDPISGAITWYRLANTIVGPREFKVSDAEVRRVLELARAAGFDREVGVRGETSARRILWHSHTQSVEPSETDIMEFPEWVDVGFVYHAPTAGTVAYKANGDFWSLDVPGGIFRNSPPVQTRNATEEVSDAR